MTIRYPCDKPHLVPPRLFLALTALVAATPAAAQRHDAQLWFQVNSNVPLAPRLRVTLEQIARISDAQDGLYQTEFGAILGWRIVDAVELGFGYRKVGAHNLSTGADEDRIRQHIVVTLGRFVGRLRVDERFNPGGSEIGFRVRPLLRYNVPLGTKGLSAFYSHESFWLPNTTAWGQRRGYDRMRNIVGATLPIGAMASADIGYLNQYRPGRGGESQMEHALTVQLSLNLHPSAPRADD